MTPFLYNLYYPPWGDRDSATPHLHCALPLHQVAIKHTHQIESDEFFLFFLVENRSSGTIKVGCLEPDQPPPAWPSARLPLLAAAMNHRWRLNSGSHPSCRRRRHVGQLFPVMPEISGHKSRAAGGPGVRPATLEVPPLGLSSNHHPSLSAAGINNATAAVGKQFSGYGAGSRRISRRRAADGGKVLCVAVCDVVHCCCEVLCVVDSPEFCCARSARRAAASR